MNHTLIILTRHHKEKQVKKNICFGLRDIQAYIEIEKRIVTMKPSNELI